MISGAKAYTIAELEIATNGFSEENLIGEGSLGSVYKAEFPDGKVNIINRTLISFTIKIFVILTRVLLLIDFGCEEYKNSNTIHH